MPLALQTTQALVLAISLLCITAEGTVGRATFYGKDNYTLNDGSCSCAKRGGIRSACASSWCFDYVGTKLPSAGQGLVAAINTPKLQNTNRCGQCVEVKCVAGKTRGLPDSEFPEPGCKANASSVFVTITDSCPCAHPNPSNQRWCCGDTTHFDLSWWAFDSIASVDQGVVDLDFQFVPARKCALAQTGVNIATCDAYYGRVSAKGLWKQAAGLLVCLAIAGVVSYLAVKALYFGS